MTALVLVHPTAFRARAVVPVPQYVLPRCDAGQADATCVCGALLAYLRGGWQHVDFCLDCLTEASPCPGHRGCGYPEPALCAHDVDWRCGEPAELLVKCAYGYEDQTCCGCCWVDAGTDGPRR